MFSYLVNAIGISVVNGVALSLPTMMVLGYPREDAVSYHSNYRLLVHPTINVKISDVRIGFLTPP